MYDLLHHDALSHQVTWTLRKTQNKALSRQASVKPKGLEPSSTWYMHMQAKAYAYVMMIMNHRQTSIECRLEMLTHPLGEQKKLNNGLAMLSLHRTIRLPKPSWTNRTYPSPLLGAHCRSALSAPSGPSGPTCRIRRRGRDDRIKGSIFARRRRDVRKLDVPF